MFARGLPGNKYPATNSVMTFNPAINKDLQTRSPIPTFVIALTIPIGSVNTNGINCVTKKPHQGNLVSQASQTTILKTIMSPNRVRYHQSGTSGYFLYKRA